MAFTVQAEPVGTGAGNYYRLKMVKTMDREGFGQPVEAARLLIPADWKYESSVRWVNTPCIANLVEVFGRASSPDGVSGFEFFTPHSWQWTDDPAARQMASQMPAQSCEMRPPVGAAELTSGYKDAWSNGLGEYVLSDSTSFNPSKAFKGNWVRLERPTR